MKRLLTLFTILSLSIALAVAVIQVMPSLLRATSGDQSSREPESSGPSPSVDGANHGGSIHYAGRPIRTTYPNDVSYLPRIGFEIAYDEQRGNPAWVAYRITLDEWDEEWKRPARFSVDEATVARISHQDYTNSGYDRGHMAPNEAISESYGREAQLQTFLMSNVVPQSPDLNQGPWRIFEELLVDRTKESEELWVVTGPIYDDDITTIADGAVEVPDGFFKVVIDEVDGQLVSLTVLTPQAVDRRADPLRFSTSIDEVELKAGWDLNPDLPDELETAIEGFSNSAW